MTFVFFCEFDSKMLHHVDVELTAVFFPVYHLHTLEVSQSMFSPLLCTLDDCACFYMCSNNNNNLNAFQQG